MWKAVNMVLPDVKITGCHFHFCQAVYRRVQKIGLAALYGSDDRVRNFVRKLYALALLPHEHVAGAFATLQRKGARFGNLDIDQLMTYFDKTWISGERWSPEDWTVYRKKIRTNNDLEGWHRKLNGKLPNANPNMYALIELLHREALLCDIQVYLVSTNLAVTHDHVIKSFKTCCK